ncbi:MAG: hydroxymethylglutaryl-CoA reductase, degradative [Deltaproteobacteria bacterium]|nr:hydroxymethylglutaryl-CoA reductase, degradative [Deltaproteobacteria bacterium]
MNKKITSQLDKFYKLSIDERRVVIRDFFGGKVTDTLSTGGVTDELLNKFIENPIGFIGMPLGIAANFIINGEEILIPMAIEEPSVIAAASHAAKIVAKSGGFTAIPPAPLTVAQIELNELAQNPEIIIENREKIIAMANESQKELVSLGGGAVDVEVRQNVGDCGRVVVHLTANCLDAMGANIVNTMAEKVAPFLEKLTGGRAGLKILTNLADKRVAEASCKVPFEYLNRGNLSGEEVARKIAAAGEFAEDDPYRAATHNKGIFNGIDAVLVATGNDWRAVEAGGHAFAATGGGYRPLAVWKIENCTLVGKLRIPMAVGVVGGASRFHPAAAAALDILGAKSAGQLSNAVVSAGLATNLAALMALSTEGIQAGHMKLHKRRL